MVIILSFFSSYTWEAVDPDRVHYKINPCGGAGDCAGSSAICAYDLKQHLSFSVGKSKGFSAPWIKNVKCHLFGFCLFYKY